MKKILGFFSLALLLVSFQNCAQHSLNSDSPTSGGVASGISAVQTSAKDPSKVVLWNPDKDQYLDLNPANGKMIAYEKFGEIRGETYCLTAEENLELATILSISDICEPRVDVSQMKDRVCTMLYKFPYVSLVKDLKEYRLGEMNTGCDEPVDLCGDKAAMLKNFAAAVVSSLDSRLCK